jgi:hypothetical protein
MIMLTMYDRLYGFIFNLYHRFMLYLYNWHKHRSKFSRMKLCDKA